jgi:inorganic pyrophosphatase
MEKPSFHAHPWHGVEIHPSSPALVTAYIEIVPGDTIKYEIDKASGLLKVDRPQLYSNIVPALYGFIPRTYCGDEIASLSRKHSQKKIVSGDKDPLDILVLSEKQINHGGILVQAIPIGGLRLIDKGEADDKIIAVLKDDAVYGQWKDLAECPEALKNRIMHYFLTYKHIPGVHGQPVETDGWYGKEIAGEVIKTAEKDYTFL